MVPLVVGVMLVHIIQKVVKIVKTVLYQAIASYCSWIITIQGEYSPINNPCGAFKLFFWERLTTKCFTSRGDCRGRVYGRAWAVSRPPLHRPLRFTQPARSSLIYVTVPKKTFKRMSPMLRMQSSRNAASLEARYKKNRGPRQSILDLNASFKKRLHWK